jgi:hypothetical protein
MYTSQSWREIIYSVSLWPTIWNMLPILYSLFATTQNQKSFKMQCVLCGWPYSCVSIRLTLEQAQQLNDKPLYTFLTGFNDKAFSILKQYWHFKHFPINFCCSGKLSILKKTLLEFLKNSFFYLHNLLLNTNFYNFAVFTKK